MADLMQVIAGQRKERDLLMARGYKPRSLTERARELLKSHEIKIITGPRRAGKSTMAILMLRDTRFAYLNFDDNSLLSSWDEEAVGTILRTVYPEYEYLMLDEVQNLPGWHLWVSKLYRQGVNIVITGSNAHMLGSEMATVLTGRYLRVEVFPLSLQETMEWNATMQPASPSDEDEVWKYLRGGGYPETVLTPALASGYLSTLFDAIVWKDIARRHHVRNITDLANLALWLVSSVACPISYNGIAEAIGLSSVTTAKKFASYMSEPYLFFYLPRYNNKLRLMNRSPRKVYIIDNGFVTAKAFSLSENTGRMLENQVFIELLRRGYNPQLTMFYYRSRNDKETDFVLRQGTRIERLIQVCADLSNPRTKRREVDSLIECAGELKCTDLTIVTLKEEGTISERGFTINVVPIKQF